MQLLQQLAATAPGKRFKHYRHVSTHLVRIRHVQRDVLAHIILHRRHVRQEALRNRHQRLSRPAVEPVKLGAVDKGGELAGTHAELVADGREAQGHMQEAADLLGQD